ncbi:MAG: hypothetical protein LBU28_00705, partial [Spirochaetaceae bacterium]|nr:hypothetical protein [Spirochaetaceae bacterium]
NFFMPAQRLKSKTRAGFRGIKVYDEPRSPLQRLIGCAELPRECKASLEARCAIYNPVELQQNVNKSYPAFTPASRSAKPYPDAGANIASVTFSK